MDLIIEKQERNIPAMNLEILTSFNKNENVIQNIIKGY
jgi:hypothetical protein